MKIYEGSLLLRWAYLPRIVNSKPLPERVNLCPFFWKMLFSPIVNPLFLIFVAIRLVWRIINGEVDWLPRPFDMNFSLLGYSVFIGLMYIEIWWITSVWAGAGWKHDLPNYFGEDSTGEFLHMGFVLWSLPHIVIIAVGIVVLLLAITDTSAGRVVKNFISAKKRKICPDIEIVS